MKHIRTILLFIGFVVVCKPVSAQYDSVRYHDGSMESQWGSSLTNDNFGCFVRVTPPYYPASLRAIRAWFQNANTGATSNWKVYTDPASAINGGVNLVYTSPAPFNNPSAGTSNTVYTSYIDITSSNISITAGDVYVGVTQATAWSMVAVDNAPVSSTYNDRQWQYQMGNWSQLVNNASSGQFGITAYFTPLTTGINELDEPLEVSVFPNPASDNVSLTFGNNTSKKHLELFSPEGLLVKTANCEQGDLFTFDLSGLSRGVYYLKISDGKHSTTQKLVKT